MQVPIALFADYANISAEGKLNILGVFDRILVHAFPAVHLQSMLVLRITASAAERGARRDFEIRLIDADGITVSQFRGELAIPEDAPLPVSINELIRLQAIQFPHPGDYTFHILINGDDKASIPFTVALLPGPPASES